MSIVPWIILAFMAFVIIAALILNITKKVFKALFVVAIIIVAVFIVSRAFNINVF